jgi:hypothetical protein
MPDALLLPCPHGRPSWHSCPHCLGINRLPAATEAKPDTDKLTAALDEIRGHLAVGMGAQDAFPAVRRLLKAVEAALSNHEPLPSGGPHGGAWCPTCYRIAPCETRKAITRELTETTDG